MMCSRSNFSIGNNDHSVYMGYYGAKFDNFFAQPDGRADTDEEAERVVNIDGIREILNKYSKEELVEGFIDMLVNGDDS